MTRFIVVLLVLSTSCAKRRCEAARAEALPEWVALQAEIDERLVAARTRLRPEDAGVEVDARAKSRFELISYWSSTVHAVTASLTAPIEGAFAPSFGEHVREASDSVHGVNDARLNTLLTPARRTAMNVLAACQR
jgi:hypothetical protein